MVTDPKELIKTKPDELVKGRERTPLVEFTGVLDNWEVEPPDSYGRTFVQLYFVDVEVLESKESYPFPIAQLGIKYSDRENSGWGMLISSLEPIGESDFRDLVGRKLRMKKHMHDYGTGDDGQAMVGEVWEVVGAEGTAPVKVDGETQAVKLMDGKTEQEWLQAVFKDNAVKSDGALVAAITGKAFLPAMIQQGRVTQDSDGVLHVV